MERDFSTEVECSIIERVAELELFKPRQDFDDLSLTPLEIEVTCGIGGYSDQDGLGFEISFKRLHIDLRPTNCNIAHYPRFEKTLQDTLFKRTSETQTQSGLKSEVSAKANLEDNYLAGILKSGLGLSAAKERNISETELTSKVTDYCYKIVSWSGAKRITIGGTNNKAEGDPRTEDNTLKGPYFLDLNRYEKAYLEAVLCHLIPNQGPTSYGVEVTLSGDFRDAVYRPLGRVLSEKAWIRKNKSAVEKALSLVTLRDQNIAEGFRPKQNAIIFARGNFSVEINKTDEQ